MPEVDPTGMTVEMEAVVPYEPATVWDLVTDVNRVSQWSPECVETGWVEGAGPRPGARFTGRNRANGMEWAVNCEVIEAERPHVFSWMVLDIGDPDRPSSTWRYELSAAPDGGTLVRQTFVHGLGNSRLREIIARSPHRAEEIVAFRRRQLLENMRVTLDAMLATVD